MSIVFSTFPLKEFEKLGNNLVVRLDETEVPSEKGVQFKYFQSKVKMTGNLNKDIIVEALMRSKYPTYGAELAAHFNGGDDLAEHQAWRTLSKQKAEHIVTNWFEITQDN